MTNIKNIIEQIEDQAEEVANAAFREMENMLIDGNSEVSIDDVFEASTEHSIVAQVQFVDNALKQITDHFHNWAMER